MATAATAPGPPKLTNMYYLRKIGSAKTCAMCGKETLSCLANAEVSDFIYVCNSHLADPGFARPAPNVGSSSPSSSPPASPGVSGAVSQAEIDKVKAEYEERQRKKKEAKEEKEKEDAKDKEKDKTWLATGISGLSMLASTTKDLVAPLYQAPAASSAPASPTLTAAQIAANSKVFILHRDIFRMRCDEKKKIWQAKEAKERAKQLSLPSVPKTGFPPLP
ncbi:DUF1742-domain-containing protein [Meredithblackwellia eburnea MCA 4105]